jgi:TonB-dependent receptor
MRNTDQKHQNGNVSKNCKQAWNFLEHAVSRFVSRSNCLQQCFCSFFLRSMRSFLTAIAVGRRLVAANKISIIFGMFLAVSSVYAQQSGGIRGMVYDKEFDAPLAGAQVSIAETGAKVTATDEGNYIFSEVPPGNYTLVFSKEGYSKQVAANVVVSGGQMADADASLSGEFTEMEEFVVQDLQIGGNSEEGLLNLRMESPALMDSVSSDLMSRAGAGDAAGALKLVAGATVQDGKYAVVRGLPDRYVNSQMNGVRLPTADPDKRAVQLDQFPAALIENIQVSKTFTPDQQGDASGGAVNVVLKSVPDEAVLSFKMGAGYNSQATGNENFRTYRGGGVNYWGLDDGLRDLPFNVEDAFAGVETRIAANKPPPTPADIARYEERERQVNRFSPVMGSETTTAPMNHNWSATAGNSWNKEDVTVGVLGTFFYNNEFEHSENGTNDKRLGLPDQNTYGYHGTDTGDRYELYDVTESKESVLWGGLLGVGAKTENHEIGLTYMQTHSAEDSVLRMDDTRAFGLGLNSADSFFRSETLRYTERDASTLQLRGDHTVPFPDWHIGSFLTLLNPKLDWTLARSDSTLWEPDMRSMLGYWTPDDPNNLAGNGTWTPYSDSGGYTGLRLWRDIGEESEQWQFNGKLPFEQWTGTEGFLKAGMFSDIVERKYDQDSFSYQHGPGWTPWTEYDGTFYGSSFTDIFGFDEATGYDGIDYDGTFPLYRRLHNEMPWQIVKSGQDADYEGLQELNAWYWMADIPLTSWLKATGGIRTEETLMKTQFKASDGESLYFFKWSSGQLSGGSVGSNEWSQADAKIEQTDILPALGFEFEPKKGLKFRGAYSKTVARPTFKEISPILQIDYLGSDQFVGNNNLNMSELKNYDLRVEYIPFDGSFLSASWFYKEIIDPIEYVTVVIAQTPYIQPFNFPDGTIEGYELEARQDFGYWHEWLRGLQVRFNATFIESQVTVPEVLPDTGVGLAGNPIGSQGQVISSSRDMRGAPDYLLNVNLTYDIEKTGTQLNLFFTQKGDTLIAGEGVTDGYFPNVYEKEFGELNFGVSQKIGKNLKLSLMAKNILDPEIQTVYRSPYISTEEVKTSYTKGIGYSISLSGEF